MPPVLPLWCHSLHRRNWLLSLCLCWMLAPACASPSAGRALKDCPECPALVVIPAGTFTMGSSVDEQSMAHAGGVALAQTARESPQRRVNMTSFAAGKYAVTKGEFAQFVSAQGYLTEAEQGDGCYVWKDQQWQVDKAWHWRNVGFAQADDHPVVCVSWRDAQAYARWVSQVSGKAFRLLTEAEREYAARAGQPTAFWWGDTISPEQANYDGRGASYNHSPQGAARHATVPVGSFKPNPFGLYNVHGNVWEWVQDCFYDRSISTAPDDASARPSVCQSGQRVLRGGSWGGYPASLRAAYRRDGAPDIPNSATGFRLAKTLSTP